MANRKKQKSKPKYSQLDTAVLALQRYARSRQIIGECDRFLTISDIRLAFNKPLYTEVDVILFADSMKNVKFTMNYKPKTVDPEKQRKSEIAKIVHNGSRSKNQNLNLLRKAKTFEQRKAEALSKHNAKQATV